MKKLRESAIMFFLLTLAGSIGQASAAPDVRGTYSGSYQAIVSNCSNSNDNGTYYATLALTIHSQAGNAFNGSATGSFDAEGSIVNEYIQLSGTITESGYISGTTTHTFLNSYGEGTFIGQLTGDTLTIENSGQDTSPGHTCAYIRYMSATLIATEYKIISPDGKAFDWFGLSVSISGRNAIVGSAGSVGIYDRVGAAYILERSGSIWNQVAKLTPSDGAIGDHFGQSVSICGAYAIVGGVGGYGSGSAYIFERSGSNWNQVAKLTPNDGAVGGYFGFNVSISERIVIVGAYRDDNGGIISGSAYIFEKSSSGWNQVAKLTANDGDTYDSFGLRVSISGDYAIIGAYGDDDNGENSGAAYIFERNGSVWNQVAKLTGSRGDIFGTGVSISGNYAIVGAGGDDDNGKNSGAAYIFERNGSVWNQVAKLTASDGSTYDGFGSSVSISGGYAIVGAQNSNYYGTRSGSAYIFEKNGGRWNQIAKLIASDGAYDDWFGSGVSISGAYAIVGSFGDDDNQANSGSAYIFNLNIPVNIAMPWIPLLLHND